MFIIDVELLKELWYHFQVLIVCFTRLQLNREDFTDHVIDNQHNMRHRYLFLEVYLITSLRHSN